MKAKKINSLRNYKEMEVQHTLREGNKVANYFTNLIFSFAGTKNINFQFIQQVPKRGRALLVMDTNQVSYIRILKMQNKAYT